MVDLRYEFTGPPHEAFVQTIEVETQIFLETEAGGFVPIGKMVWQRIEIWQLDDKGTLDRVRSGADVGNAFDEHFIDMDDHLGGLKLGDIAGKIKFSTTIKLQVEQGDDMIDPAPDEDGIGLFHIFLSQKKFVQNSGAEAPVGLDGPFDAIQPIRRGTPALTLTHEFEGTALAEGGHISGASLVTRPEPADYTSIESAD